VLTLEQHARYRTRIGRRIQAVLGSDHEGEDLVQEVLIVVFTKIGSVRDPACLDGWVYQVTANVLRNVMRQRRHRRRALGEFSAARQDATFDANVDGVVLASRAIRLMDRLSPKESALLAAHWFSTKQKDAIAEEVGCSSSTLRRRVTRARARFDRLASRDPVLRHYLRDERRSGKNAQASCRSSSSSTS
jgi:RNA polymerase sigma-70 factor (ECF subfamily)